MKDSIGSDYCGPLNNPIFINPSFIAQARGQDLKAFIGDHLREPDVLRSLADAWAELMEQRSQAESDGRVLQHGNVFVQNRSLAGQPLTLTFTDGDGQEASSYQHPRRCELDRHELDRRELDPPEQATERLSALVIYLSILALSENPKLWQNYRVDRSEGLLFVASDFLNPTQSSLFRNLAKLPDPIAALSRQLESMCSMAPDAELPSLAQVIDYAERDTVSQRQPSPTPPTQFRQQAPAQPSTTLAQESINWPVLGMEVIALIVRMAIATLYWLATTVICCLALPFQMADASPLQASAPSQDSDSGQEQDTQEQDTQEQDTQEEIPLDNVWA